MNISNNATHNEEFVVDIGDPGHGYVARSDLRGSITNTSGPYLEVPEAIYIKEMFTMHTEGNPQVGKAHN